MKIALFGSTGRIGKRILNEALTRGHHVTAIVRDASHSSNSNANLAFKTGDVLKAESIVMATKGAEIVISAYGPGAGDADQIVTAAKALVEGVGLNQPMRLIAVGGAGSLEVAPGLQLVDTPDFPPANRKASLAQRDALAVFRGAPFDWTYVSPAAEIKEGTRTGKYRIGADQLVVNEKGESRISMEDYAKAIIDEAEKPQFARKRFTLAY
jgi:putative NADH-flavin reductase